MKFPLIIINIYLNGFLGWCFVGSAGWFGVG
jgi:hypothetical protein